LLRQGRLKIGIVSALDARSGISRSVSTLIHYFRERALLFVIGRKLYPNFHEEFPRTTRKILVPDLIAAPIFILLISLFKSVNILNSHGVSGTISSSIAKILSLGKLKNICFLYDKEEVDFINQDYLKSRLIRFFMKINAIDLVLVLDGNMKGYVRENLKNTKVTVIRLGIHPNVIRGFYAVSRDEKRFLFQKGRVKKILFHGILIPRRRLEDLLVALAEVKEKIEEDIALYVSGSIGFGPSYVSYLNRLIIEMGLDSNVSFLGELSDLELLRMYKCTDVFVWPCDQQTWGLAPLEAMFCRKPVIVSRGAGVSEVLNEQVALLVPPRNPLALADALLRLFRDVELCKRLANNGHKYVADNLTYINTGKSLEHIFFEVLSF